ncbi:MAG: glycosyltransferase family 9 protein [Pseudobdellovibrio sp.]
MKILVIRFSSIGDLTQALSIPAVLHEHFNTDSQKTCEVHFLTRSDFSELLDHNPSIQKIWTVNRSQGFKSLMQTIQKLNQENFDLIYDAHNNLRSFFVRNFVSAKQVVVKPMERWKRFLLLNFKINKFEKPFSGQRDLLKPLEKIGIPFQLPKAPQIFLSESVLQKVRLLLENLNLKPSEFIVFVPSAAYPLKRWPIDHWVKLAEIYKNTKIVVLAGPQDHFTQDLNHLTHIYNLTGQTSLIESAAIIQYAQFVVTNDTGLLHFSEQLGQKTIALMGPAPFGYPSRTTTQILEIDLPCRPCSKHGQGPCSNKEYQKCLRDITPNVVHQRIQARFNK